MGRSPVTIFLAAAPPGFGLLTLALGMDANWDLRNYHYYNAYAFLTGRENYDMLVAQLPTFFNPLIDVPFFVATQAWPARVVGFLLGSIQGLNILPLYGIAHRLLRIEHPERRRLAAASLALLGMLGAGALSEIGTTFYDNVVSLGPLTALWLIVRRFDAIEHGDFRVVWRPLVLAGVVTGIAVGLKQPIVTLAIGLCLGFLFVPCGVVRRLSLAFLFGVGVLVGMSASAGFWIWHLWQTYGNPVFPFYNQLFHSPWALASDYHDVFYFPKSPWTRAFFPVAYLFNPRLTAESDFFDLRILFSFILVPLGLVATLFARRMRSTPISTSTETRFFLAALAIGYSTWLAMFCIYRYLIAYEMLAPLTITLAIGLFPLAPRTRDRIVIGALALAAVIVQPMDWIRVPWGERWVAATVPRIAEPARTLVLITGHEPLSYLIPFFPREVRFLRIHGGFTGPYEPNVRFNVEMRRIVAAHRGPIFVLFNPNEQKFANRYLAAYELKIEHDACESVPSNIGYVPYDFCALRFVK